jgi:hypothetical protein
MQGRRGNDGNRRKLRDRIAAILTVPMGRRREPVVIAPAVIAPAVMARSGSDEAIPGRGMDRIAASLSLVAITAGAMTNNGFVYSGGRNEKS